jgi:hypothetical protein
MKAVLLALFLIFSVSAYDKVLLRDVKSIVLNKGQYTQARRTTPISQLTCMGGSARSRSHEVSQVQCTNMGFDGNDYTWKCQSDLSSDLKLGKVTVSCEGYSYPSDSYVTVGSCGLKYELEYTGKSSGGHTTTRTTRYYRTDTSDFLEMFAFICVFVIVIIVFMGIVNFRSRSYYYGDSSVHHIPVYRPWYYPSYWFVPSRPSYRVEETTYTTHSGSADSWDRSRESSSNHTSTSFGGTERR